MTDASAVVSWLDPSKTTVLSQANPFILTGVANDETYYISVVGSGCGDTLPVLVRPFTNPELTVNAAGYSSCTHNVTLKLTSLSDLSATVTWLDVHKNSLGTGNPLTITEAPADNGIHYVVATGTTCQSDTVPFHVSTGSAPIITVDPQLTSCDTIVTFKLKSLSDAAATVKWLASDKSTVVATGSSVTATVKTDATYYVYAEGATAGCNSDTLAVDVKVNTAPVITLNPGGYESCTNQVTLQLLTLSDWSAKIEWLNASGQVLATGNPAIINNASDGSNYKVRVTGKGCATPVEEVFGVTTNKTALTLRIEPTWDNCSTNVTVSLDTLSDWGAIVKWYDADGNQFATGNPIVISNAQAGNYSVVAQGATSGCLSDTAHFSITECGITGGAGILAEADPDTICLGNTAELTVTSLDDDFTPVTYTWTPATGLSATNIDNPVFTPNTAGSFDFYVEVTGMKNGTSVTYKDTVNVFVNNANAPELDALPSINCQNEELFAVDTGAVKSESYQWYVNGAAIAGATDSVYTWTIAPSKDTVSVVGIAANGCRSDKASVVLDIASPIVLVTNPVDGDVSSVSIGTSVPGGGITSVTGGTPFTGGAQPYRYYWNIPADATLNAGQTLYFPFAAKDVAYDFSVYVEDARGCKSDTAKWHVDVTGWDTLCIDMASVYGNTVCTNGAAVLRAQVCDGIICNGTPGCTPGTGPYVYEWYQEGSSVPVRTVTTFSEQDEWMVVPTAPVKYYVKVKDQGAVPLAFAYDSVSLTIQATTAPIADAGVDQTIMSGARTVLMGGASNGSAPYEWHWSPVNGLVAGEDTLQYPQTQTLMADSEYRLYVVDDASCVSLPDTMQVKISPNGWKLVINPEKDTICGNITRLITVRKATGSWNAGETISWTLDPASTTGVVYNTRKDSLWFTPAGAGEYTFVAQVTDGTKTAAVRSDIVVKAGNSPEFTLQTTPAMCGNDTVKVVYLPGSTQADRFTWKIGGVVIDTVIPYFVLPNPGTVTNYPVEVTGYVTGCSSNTISTNVSVEPSPVLNAVLTDSCGQAVVLVTGSGATQNYTWNITPAGAITAQTALNTASCTIPSAGNYQVEVTATNGRCSVSRTLTGTVHARPSWVGNTWISAPDALHFGVPASVSAQVAATGGLPYTEGSSNFYKYYWFSGVGVGNGLPKDTVERAGTYNQTVLSGGSYTVRVVAQDSNRCYTDTLVASVVISSGTLDVTLESLYGDTICQNGAALLEATVRGAVMPCDFRWYKGNSTVAVDSVIGTNVLHIFKWVDMADAGEYRVVVTDNVGYEGTDTLELVVNNTKTAPGISAGPDMTIQANSSTALLGSVTAPTVAPYQWYWSPADKLASVADTGYQYPQTALLTADQGYQLVVKDAANCVSRPDSVKVVIDNTNGMCITAVPEVDTICFNNTLLWQVKDLCHTLDGSETYTWSGLYSSLLNSTTLDTSRFIPLAGSNAGWYEYAVAVEKGGLTSAARVRVNLLNMQAPRLDLDGSWNCLTDTVRVANSGETATDYIWEWDGIAVHTTDTFFTIGTTGEHTLKIYAESANGCRSDITELSVKVGTIPVVDIIEPYIVAYRDSSFDLHLDQSDVMWVTGYGQFDISWEPVSRIDGSATGIDVSSTQMTGDTMYIVQVTDTVNPACFGTDTVMAYLIPDSIGIDINKDPSGKMAIEWDHTQPGLEYADSVRIMNVKWDGYAVATPYAPRAMSSIDIDKYLVDISNDTLEFFYINASRYISEAGRSYYSFSSDTVGYMKQWLLLNSGNANSKNDNYITYPFDMSAKGLVTSQDLGNYIGQYITGLYNGKNVINSISSFDIMDQNWDNFRDYYSKGLGIWQTSPTFNLMIGSIYRIVLNSDASDRELLLYGKLPSVFEYNLKNSASTTDRLKGENYIAFPLNLCNKRKLMELGDEISDINSVARFTFYVDQDWSARAYYSKGLGIWTSGMSEKGYPWLPIRVVVDSNSNFKK